MIVTPFGGYKMSFDLPMQLVSPFEFFLRHVDIYKLS
jgi:hypothetical protein